MLLSYYNFHSIHVYNSMLQFNAVYNSKLQNMQLKMYVVIKKSKELKKMIYFLENVLKIFSKR